MQKMMVRRDDFVDLLPGCQERFDQDLFDLAFFSLFT